MTASHVLEPGRAVNGCPMFPNPGISMSTTSRYKAGGECWGDATFHIFIMALLTRDYFILNKDKRSSWEAAWLVGTTMDKPLPKMCIDAISHYLETGSLDYLPDNSDSILNVLTDGLDDLKEITLQIPHKCKYNLLYFDDPFLTLYIVIQGEERPPGNPLQMHVEMYLASQNPPAASASAPPVYQGQAGPISILNPTTPVRSDTKGKAKEKAKPSKKGKDSMSLDSHSQHLYT